jgi:hypothetical protein
MALNELIGLTLMVGLNCRKLVRRLGYENKPFSLSGSLKQKLDEF